MNLNIENMQQVKEIMEFAKWMREKPEEWKQFKIDLKFLSKEMEELFNDLS